MSRTCPQCQAQILETQRFCRYCGYRLDEGLQDYVETMTYNQPRLPVAPRVEGYSGYPTWSPPVAGETTPLRQCARRSKLLYGVLALILVGALGVGSLFFFGGTGSRVIPFSGGQAITVTQPSYLGVYFDDEEADGALIDSAATGEPADQAGLVGGDLIVEVDGKPIKSQRDMRRVLASTPPGSRLNIKFLRDGQLLETVLVTAARGDFSDQPAAGPHGFFGIDPDSLQRVLIREKNIWGVRLDSVLTNRPADMAGIRQGDIVIEFDGHPIRTPREFIRRIHATEPYSVVEVKVVRGGEELVIPVKMGKND